MMEIDFYHIDAFEVNVFLPIYRALESIGVKPRPILPNEQANTAAAGYLDVEECVKFYIKNKIKYYSDPNYNNTVCTTQGSEFLSLYKNLRIRIPYGPGLDPFGWGLTRKSTLGFDHILVHGEYYRNYLSHFFDSDKIHVGGYPRYDDYFSSDFNNRVDTKAIPFDIDNALDTILILPTWGEHSSLNKLLKLSEIIQGRFNILIKPHHLSVVRELETLEHLEDNGVIILRESDVLVKALALSDIVICDIRSSVFSESILANKKTIGLVINNKDLEWINQQNLNLICYIAVNSNDLIEAIKKYLHHDEFINSRNLWIQDRVEIRDGSSSLATAKILYECVNTPHIRLLRKTLRRIFGSVFRNTRLNPRLSTNIISRLHLLIIKSLGNFK